MDREAIDALRADQETHKYLHALVVLAKERNESDQRAQAHALKHLSSIAAMSNWVALCAVVATCFLLYRLW